MHRLVTKEPKGPIPAVVEFRNINRTAGADAVLVAVVWGRGGESIGPVAGDADGAILVRFERRSVKLARAALGGGDDAGRHAQSGGNGVAIHRQLLDGVQGRTGPRRVAIVAIHHRYAVHKIVG